MRKSTWMMLMAVLTGVFCCQAGVLAAQVTVSGKPVPLPVRATLQIEEAAPAAAEGEEQTEEGAEATENAVEDSTKVVRLKKFMVYGLADPDTVAISYDDNTYGYVDRAQFQMLLPKIHLDELPDISPYSTLTVGSRGNEVSAMQEQLIKLDVLTGAADGAYGNGTAGAVSSFQENNGLPATGAADPLTRLIIAGKAEKTLNKKLKTEYPTELTVEDKFSSILDDVNANLESYLTPEWSFTYDKFEGIGSIVCGVPAGTPAVESPAIDHIILETAFKVVLAKNETEGSIEVIPAMTINSTGACRPYVQSVIFSSGNDICELKDAVNSGGLDGITLYENAYVPLTAEAVEFLSGHEDIEVRINGRNNIYDYNMGVNRDSLKFFLDAVGANIA